MTGFELRLRNKVDEIVAFDVNEIGSDQVEIHSKNFDMTCDQCTAQFQSLSEAQTHYFTSHDKARGYIKCCDMKIREEALVKEHIAYHFNPDIH